MTSQRILWTALPNGSIERDGRSFARLSVFVAPRLAPDGGRGKLGEFPDWINWTETAAKIRGFEVDIDGATSVSAQVVAPSPLAPSLWPRLFPRGMPVHTFEFEDYSKRTIVSFPVADTLTSLRESYQSLIFASPLEPPHLQTTLTELQPFAVDLTPALVSRLRGRMREEQARNPRDIHDLRRRRARYDAAECTARALLFHQSTGETEAPQLPEPGQQMQDLFDFHKGLSMLGDYAALMRRLGLVLDIEMPVEEFTTFSAVSSPRRLRVRPRWQPQDGVTTNETSLWTAYLWDGRHFAAAPRPGGPPDIIDGLLNLGSGQFDLEELDVDGAILKQANAAATLNLSLPKRAPDAPAREAPASLRSAGFALTCRGRSLRLHGFFNRASARNTQLESGTDPETFFAEDLIRGFVVDTWDSLSGRWHSLFRRIGEYRFQDSTILSIEDEGFSQTAMTQKIMPPGAQPSDEVRLHETLWCWDGWSLAAPRPGKTIVSGSGSGSLPERIGNDAHTSLPMSVTFQAVPRSLPRLRFGARYRMRARAVDLAGNSRSLTEAGESAVIPSHGAHPYLRFDPVHAPTVVLREALDNTQRPGESVDRLVIRSANATPVADEAPTTQSAERHIIPPRASLLCCEWHGMLDGANGRVLADSASYNMLRTRDAAELTYGADDLPIATAATFTPPYLPEPMARGAALRNLPGTEQGTIGEVDATGILSHTRVPGAIVRPGSVTKIPFPPTWPAVPGFLLSIAEGDAPPAWDSINRRLTVCLPKAEVVDVPLSSFVNTGDLRLFGVWDWLREIIDGRATLNGRNPAQMLNLGVQTTHVAQYALEGGLWSITPARMLRLVHAVQQPMRVPTAKLTAVRSDASTAARLMGEIAVHGKSTGIVDIHAEWTDPVDDPQEDAPREVDFVNHVDTIPVRDLSPTLLRNGDRLVGQYIPERDVVLCQGHAFPRHEFGDTKHHKVRYRLTGTSRFTDCFDPNEPGGFIRTGDEFLVDVPASARPAPPAIEYVVPTFGWQRHADTNLIASVRLGRGLRVYMKRGWHSSGEGELLGIILRPAGLPSPSDEEREAMKSFFTQWGADPIFGGPALPILPSRSSFPREVAGAYDLYLPELRQGHAAVSGHRVGYDAVRKRWYCDIEVDTREAYFPFVRLALARYQPSANRGCHLSPVILVAFSQVAPDRTMIATYDPDDSSLVHVVVSGFTFNASKEPTLGVDHTVPSGSKVRIEVQQRLAGVDDELGWEPSPSAVITALDTQEQATVLWRGTVRLPSPRLPDQFRIIAREYETHPGDSEPTWITFNGTRLPLGPFPNRIERTVYADGIVL